MSQSPAGDENAFHVKRGEHLIADTIYALSSGRPPAPIAVIRLSGPAAGSVLGALCRKPPQPRQAALRRLRHPATDAVLDDALVLWLPGPASETGEDMAELHLHGGLAVIAGLFDALAGFEGVRPAGPGEFTRRSFENGKLDLVQAEAIADLIDAQTEGQRRQAARQLEGALGTLYDGWRDELMRALAWLEAELDFSDEGDVPGSLRDEILQIALRLHEAITKHLADGRRGERLRDGVRVVIVGPPNAGKSTLLNALARRDAAIVSETAGTTRDIIEVHLDLAGYPVILTDTAGLRDSGDTIEQEGVRRARAAMQGADVIVRLTPAAASATAARETLSGDAQLIEVVSKCDELSASPSSSAGHRLSVKTGEGLEELVRMIADRAASLCGRDEAPVLTRARHRAALTQCLAALERFRAAAGTQGGELLAEDLRLATRSLGRITGRVGVEDMLDLVFADFCIGK